MYTHIILLVHNLENKALTELFTLNHSLLYLSLIVT